MSKWPKLLTIENVTDESTYKHESLPACRLLRAAVPTEEHIGLVARFA